jgi:hypothetical protein
MKTKNQSAHLLHVEVAHLVQQEVVHQDLLVGTLLVHHALAVHPGLLEAVHLQVDHQSAAVHQAEDLQAVAPAVHQREAVLPVEVHQREVAHLAADHQREVVHLAAVLLAVVLAALQRKAVLLAAAHPGQNVEDLQVQSVARQNEIHRVKLIQSRH